MIAPDEHRRSPEAADRRAKALLPPLGLLTVAGLTPPDIDVELIDESVTGVDYCRSADLVGLTATTANAPRAYEIAGEFRNRGVPVVMGGIHATALPHEALQYVDAVGWGEAEGFWTDLLTDFKAGKLKKLYRGSGLAPGEAFGRPRRELITPRDYLLFNSLQTTRGCPMDCSFCSVTKFYGRRYRQYPVESVMEELRALPPGPIVFVDDNILCSPAHARRLFKEMIPLRREWLGQASTNCLEEDETIALAAQSGCRCFFVGLESVRQDNLKSVHKSFNRVERFAGMIKKLHRFGIGIIGAFIFGLDHDDEKVFRQTVKFAQRAKVDAAQFSVLIPLPGTTDSDALENQGRIFDRDWSHYNGTCVVFHPRGLQPPALEAGLHWAYNHFYSLGSIVRRMWGHRGKHKPLSWKINLAFRVRVENWLRVLGSELSTSCAASPSASDGSLVSRG